jgi:hypothetical protein
MFRCLECNEVVKTEEGMAGHKCPMGPQARLPVLENEVRNMLRMFYRDDVPERRELGPTGSIVLVAVLRTTAERWRSLLDSES